MGSEVIQRVRDAGIVGAGGAGFPSHVKLNAKVDVVIANGAECEPLVHVDQELMISRSAEIIQGMRYVIETTGAERGVLGVKKKYTKAINALRQAIGDNKDLSVFELGNFYPA